MQCSAVQPRGVIEILVMMKFHTRKWQTPARPHGHFQMFAGLMIKLGETEFQAFGDGEGELMCALRCFAYTYTISSVIRLFRNFPV